MEKTYTIIAGVNGVGKSSFTGVLKHERNLGTVIDIDQIIRQEASGDILNGSRLGVAQIDECLQNSQSFSQETTLSGHHILKTIQLAKSSGYNIRLYYIGLNTAEESIMRIKNRVQKGGHDISETLVIRRFDKRFADLNKIISDCDEIQFYDNNNGFQLIAEITNNNLVIKAHPLPEWFSDF